MAVGVPASAVIVSCCRPFHHMLPRECTDEAWLLSCCDRPPPVPAWRGVSAVQGCRFGR